MTRILSGIVLLASSMAFAQEPVAPVAPSVNVDAPGSVTRQAPNPGQAPRLIDRTFSKVEYALGPGDEIVVKAVDLEVYDGSPVLINSRGQVNLPLVGRVMAGGRTVEQLETDLNKLLEEYLHEPQVMVTIEKFRSRPVSVFGAVQNPGVHQLEGPKGLYEVITLAGGLTNEAGDTIRVRRNLEYGELPLPGAAVDPTGKHSTAEIDIREFIDMSDPVLNIGMMPHDSVSVPRADIVYVVGHVNRGGGFVTKGEITLLEALSLAGGFQRHANTKKARILRLQSGREERVQIEVNLKKLLRGVGEDPRMKPGDILFVPHNSLQEFGQEIATSAIGAATYGIIYRTGR